MKLSKWANPFLILFLILSMNIIAAGTSEKFISPENDLSSADKEKIINEINILFGKSINASENLDISGIKDAVNDSLKAGFLDNGVYFNSFDILFNGFKEAVRNIKSQKITITNKKITVLSEKVVLLTASGNGAASLNDGRTLNGNFAWSFIYLKIDNEWKVIHSHMSNQR